MNYAPFNRNQLVHQKTSAKCLFLVNTKIQLRWRMKATAELF